MIDINTKAKAHWLTKQIIAWPIGYGSGGVYLLHYDPKGSIETAQLGLQGGNNIPLEFLEDQLSPELAEKFPHLKHASMLKIPDQHLGSVPDIIKGQFGVSVAAIDGTILDATSLQISGVLDDLYANDEPLGVILDKDLPTLRVWAPTAKSVILHLFPDSNPETRSRTFPMIWDSETGIWSISGGSDWINQYYLYEVEVYVRQEGKVVRNLVTDPYSISMAMNSTRSQIVNIDDPALKPDNWDTLEKPKLKGFNEIVIYELHLRDFSAFDPGVPEEHRGTYLAFTHQESHGMRHLKRLSEAGLTHVHMMPVFDIATISENKSEWVMPNYDELTGYPSDSERQQAILADFRKKDGYNWGYDPFHYTTPEGSYASEPDGASRIREFRQMVMALNQIGLRVVMDVVYSHTHAAGQSEKSVLDRVVPGYYHRLDNDGNVTTSTCCPDTVSEHTMMEKLMVDSLLTWARDYKIDGFRFDLMGHHMVRNLEAVRQALNSLSLEKDGVNGKSIYLYGEGWNFGEVANNARGVNATQLNLAGTGIGTFNDRVRDAVRGGSPFSRLQEQGFVTGLYLDPNEFTDLPEGSQLAKLLEIKDQLRVSLAGNLAEFALVNAQGRQVRGAEIGYNGNPAGYTKAPQENVVYVSAHDNETLFDAIQLKAPLNADMDERVRMQNLALSILALSQGVPFFHAGSELLRSKSLDRDSYDSGDWFNRLDFTYQSNNWGVGLPPEEKNGSNWPIMRELLSRPELKPSQEHILRSVAHFEEMLCIRKSSPLFRLQTADDVMGRVHFHNTGPHQVPGLIVMSIRDDGLSPVDENYDLIVVLFNADDETQTFTMDDLGDSRIFPHPIQASSNDPVVQQAVFDRENNTFTVPGRTTVVFVRRRSPD